MSNSKSDINTRRNRASVFFALAVIAICMAYYGLEWKNGRVQMADFRVYYDAATAITSGGQVYGKAFGLSSGFYKYSPLACIPFIPLTWMSYTEASIVYYTLLSLTIAWFLIRVALDLQRCGNQMKNPLLLALLTGVFLMDHLERELHLGNINLFLLVMLYACYRLWVAQRNFASGAMLGAVLLFKPHFIILLPYFIWKKQFKALAAAGAAVIIGLVLPALLLGFYKNTRLLLQWLGAMEDHNTALQKSPNTIYGLINHTFLSNQAGSWLIILSLALLCAAFVYLMRHNDRKMTNQPWSSQPRYIEFFLLVALVPNLVHTDTEHFMWTWPLIAFVFYRLLSQEYLPSRFFIVFLMILAFIPYAINSPDIVGKKRQQLFDEGLLGASNLLIMGLAVFLSNHVNRDKPTA